MSGEFTLRRTVAAPYDETLQATRDALAEQGFGVLTEIDLAATLHAKLGVEIPAQVILGACRPPLAYAAVQADPAIATLLPCNVVVRVEDDDTTVVEALDPQAMVAFAGDQPAVREIAADARTRIQAALATLTAQED